ncbi:hypothetical protein BG58_18295 [Caballeronia jiangsuensis]|nr:hypothetical protein BG58_18295 [Caballeronia jiangsuensis]
MFSGAVADAERICAKVQHMRAIAKFLHSLCRTEKLDTSEMPDDTPSVPSDPHSKESIGTAEEKDSRNYGTCGAAHAYYDAQRQLIKQRADHDGT